MNNILLVVLLLVFVTACTSTPEGPNMKEGKWEMSVRMDVPGLPFAVPPVMYNQCLTRQDLIPQNVNKKGEQLCRVTENKIQGDILTWTVACETPQGESVTRGTIIYKGESFEGEMTINPAPDMPPMTQKMSGKYIGPCD